MLVAPQSINLKRRLELLEKDHPIITGTGTDFQLAGTGDLPMKALPSGNTIQNTNYRTYKCAGTETGDYYFTYNNINYQFTMPTIEEGSILVFNTETLKLYLGDTEITTTTDNTGILITFAVTPNPDYTTEINNVEGNIIVTSSNSDNTKSNTLIFPLQEGQKLMQGDYLADDGIHHTRWQDVFVGSKNWDRVINMNGYSRFRQIISKQSKNYNNSKCNYGKYYDLTFNYGSKGNYMIYDGSEFYICDDEEVTLSDWKAKLTKENLIIEYELAQEIIEPYTPEQQQAYKKLLKMQSYYDVTNISGSSDNANPIITAEALKSMKALPKYSYDSTTQTLTITEG